MLDYIVSTTDLKTKTARRGRQPRLEHALYININNVTLTKLPTEEGYKPYEYAIADETGADSMAWTAGKDCIFPALTSFEDLKSVQGDKRLEYVIDRIGFLYFKQQDMTERKYILNMDFREHPEKENSAITRTIDEFKRKLTTLTMLW